MSFFSRLFGSSNNPTRINQVKINQSVLGYPLPVVMGKAVVQQSILWVDGLRAKAESAGKGIGGKGSTFLYTADVIAALCNGPISGVCDVWSGQSWLSGAIASESYTIAGGTPTYTPTNASGFGADHGVGKSNAYSGSFSDLGSSGTALSGSDASPFRRVAFGASLATGQYSINPSTNVYSFSPADVGTTVVLTYSYQINIIKQQENNLVPSSKQIQIGGTFTFHEDDGVAYYTGPNDGVALTKVSGTPTVTGTYSVTGSAPATYHFAPGDVNAEVKITYKIQNNSVIPTGASKILTFSVFEGELGQAIWSFLSSTFPQAALAYTGIAYVAYNPMTLGMSTDIQQNKFEVLTPDAFGSGVVDCNPVQCIKQVLTNKVWGLGAGPVPFPESAIDMGPGGTWGHGVTVDPSAVTSASSRRSATTAGQTGSDWNNVSAMIAPKGRPGFVSFTIGGGTIYANGYGFNIPSTAVITGIEIEWDGSGFNTHGTPVGSVVNISLESSPGTAIVTRSNVKQGASSANTTGGANDQFGTVLTPAIVNSPGFGVSFQPGSGAAHGTVVLNPYIKIYYSSLPGARNASSAAYNWFAANSFFISPVIDHQDSAGAVMSKWLEAGMCAAFMSEGLLKLVPFGDTSAAANGCTWTAPTVFAASLDDTCFVPRSEGEDPVKISSSPWQDAYNTVQVQWTNRNNQYAPEITPESDQAAINRYGSRIEDPQSFDFIHTLAAATFAASMRVKRNVYTRNTYEFNLPFNYSFLEPMDVVDITTSSVWASGNNNVSLGVVNRPVRIIKIVDNPTAEGLMITAEDYPFGVHQPTLYNKDMGAAELQQNIFADPGDSEVILFEATSRLTGHKGNQIWMGATGTADEWGSTNVWVSQDGTKYLQVGTIDTRARLGELTAAFPSGGDPDTVNSLVVALAENSAQIEAGTTTDADLGNTLAFVDGEIIAYSAAAITGQDQYTLNGYIRRGLLGSSVAAHAIGGLFLRLDNTVFKYTYDPIWAGQTLHFKFQSVNKWGNSAQDLSALTSVPFTVPGANPGTIDASSGLVILTGPHRPTPPIDFPIGVGRLGWNEVGTLTKWLAQTSASVPYWNLTNDTIITSTGAPASYGGGKQTFQANAGIGGSFYLGTSRTQQGTNPILFTTDAKLHYDAIGASAMVRVGIANGNNWTAGDSYLGFETNKGGGAVWGNWFIRAGGPGLTPVNIDTGVTIGDGVQYNLSIAVNQAGTQAVFSINGTVVATISTVPSAALALAFYMNGITFSGSFFYTVGALSLTY